MLYPGDMVSAPGTKDRKYRSCDTTYSSCGVDPAVAYYRELSHASISFPPSNAEATVTGFKYSSFAYIPLGFPCGPILLPSCTVSFTK